ncbi:unnamed protein product [Dovyalis caffra]|uniref:DRBM domain-containing protein n=1 Tax=Dovyalis caffra TaxID=77055 RepID=A0AAV1RWY7_9ROSI|nr:unnamed protein product [Dovyalis caffra]
MYKSKLQELCQQREWELPSYEASKQGQAHNPRFLATVTVNGISFHSPSPSNTSKGAQNNAAKLAYDHFSLSRPSSSPSLPEVAAGSLRARNGAIICLSPGGTMQLNTQDTNQTPQINEAVAVAKNDESFGGESKSSLVLFGFNMTLTQSCTVSGATLLIKVAAGSLSVSTGATNHLSPGGTLQLNTKDANQTPQVNEAMAVAKNDENFGGTVMDTGERPTPSFGINVHHLLDLIDLSISSIACACGRLFKNQLQTYAQKRNFTLPLYSCERVGPPHASRFKCKVTVNGQTYESQDYFPTLNKAEHEAAKAALMSLLPNGGEEDELGYKNLLQELAQREGCGLPTYGTNKSGEAHVPTFISTVEIKGEIFTGQGAKTKKQAEMSAAKIAYTALKQRYSSQSPAFFSPARQFQEARQISQVLDTACEVKEGTQSTTCLSPARQGNGAPQFSASSLRADLTAYLQQNIQPKLPSGQAEEDKRTQLKDVLIGGHKFSDLSSLLTRSRMVVKESYGHSTFELLAAPSIASPGLGSGSDVRSIASSSGGAISPLPKHDLSSSPLPKHDLSSSPLPSDSSTNLATSSSIERLVGKSTSCQSRVIVHPRGTLITYPEGSIVLPISDDEWVAVKLPPQLSR